MFYNDFQHGSVTKQTIKSDKVFNLVADLKSRNCGIDGVGFQMHADINWTDEDIAGIAMNMQRYHDIGIQVQITELEVKCCSNCKDTCPFEVWTTELLQQQADVYSKMYQVCIDEPNCTATTSWGFTDATPWLGGILIF